MLYQGNGERAEKILAELVRYIDGNFFSELYDLRDCAIGMFHIQMGDLARVPFWLSGGEKLPIDIPVDMGRDRIMCALYKYAIRDYESAYLTLVELDEVFVERRLWATRLISLIAKAVCLLRMNLPEKSVLAFRQAYDMTWQNDITICFAEFGQDMSALVETVWERGGQAFDGRWLDKVCASARECDKRRAVMRKRYGSAYTRIERQPAKLSPREMQLLKYLSQGLTRRDIEVCMGISLHGVKKHITCIYSKLGAVNRVDAIHIAAAHGLLEP